MYPIYDIKQMCVPNSPLFQRPGYMITPFFKYMNGLILGIGLAQILTPMYMHIFFAQIPVKPLFSHSHKAGFLIMRVICKLVYKSQMI